MNLTCQTAALAAARLQRAANNLALREARL